MVVATTVAAHATVDHSMPLHKGFAIDSGRRLLHGKRLFCWVRPAGRTYLEVKVLYSPGKGKS